jgi:cytochrome c oxidase subunit 4
MMNESVEVREAEELDHHPQPRQYVKVAVILAIVTALEVAIYYVDALADVIVPLLLAFAVIKFIMVALWFMHLRFDSRMFRRFFITGIILALAVFGIVLWIFFTHLGGPAPTAA